MKRIDTGDHDHNEQPKKIQRLGSGPLHSACGEGDQSNLKIPSSIILFQFHEAAESRNTKVLFGFVRTFVERSRFPALRFRWSSTQAQANITVPEAGTFHIHCHIKSVLSEHSKKHSIYSVCLSSWGGKHRDSFKGS